MRATSISVFTALIGLAAAIPQKRAISTKCDIEGMDLGAVSDDDKVDAAQCHELIEGFEKDPDASTEVPAGIQYAMGCQTDCHVVIESMADGFEMTNKEIVDDIRKVIDDCDSPFTGTFIEDEGPKARKTAIYKFHSEIC